MTRAFLGLGSNLGDRLAYLREAVAAMFAGAIGHAKNPPSHRDVKMNRQTAARLVVFASHLLDVVDTRRGAAGSA